ncbi:MAG TPA: hypothetical protein PKW80_05945 [Bacteroidales bacterium]|nr:hypothetical protein [Bacteroidales bacterium]
MAKMNLKIKILHWLPRILCIVAIIFISLFAADTFSSDHTFWQKIINFLIHLIPSFVMLIMLIIAWKRDLFGGIAFILAGLVFIPIVFSMNRNADQSVASGLFAVAGVALPFVLVGVLFLISYSQKRTAKTKQELK